MDSLCGLVFITGIAVVSSSKCHTWWFADHNSSGGCRCGSELNGRLICHDNYSVDISAGVCITYNGENESALVVGDCAYGSHSKMISRKYSRLPSNQTDVNSSQCNTYHREGLFCGKCKRGYGPAVYSFNLDCADCERMPTALAITCYMLLELTPITIFFIIILVFHFNLMTGPILGYVMYCQAVINTLQYSMYLYSSLFYNVPPVLAILGHLSLALSGIWNLDFFQFTIPPFCISEKLTEIHLHMLGFVSSLYPLFLVIVSYSVIELNARYGCTSKCMRCMLTSDENVKHSIIHAFATFTMLSMSMTMCRGYAILQTTTVLDIHGSVLKKVLFCDPSIEMYSPQHSPYVVISLTIVTLLVVFPALFVCVYPTRFYNKVTHFISARKQLSLKIFAETVHCGFKDGLNNTRDYRMLPGVIILAGFAFSLLMSTLPHYGFDGFPPLTIGLIFAVLSFIVSFTHPCKSLAANISVSFHLLLIGTLSLLCALWWQDMVLNSEVLASWIIALSFIPHVLIMSWIGHRLLEKFDCYSRCIRFIVSALHEIYELCHFTRLRHYQVITDTDDEIQPLM